MSSSSSSFAAKPISTMSHFLLSPSPSSSSISTNHLPHFSLPPKPIFNLHLSTSFKPSFSLSFPRNPNKFLTFLSSQEDDNTLVLQADEEEEEEDVGWGSESVPEAVEASSGESPAEDSGETEVEQQFAEPPEDAKIFVGNLPYDVDSEQLAQLFQQAGVVEISEVIYNRETDQSRGFGFVTMSTVEEAEKAVEMLHRYELGGRYLTVNKAAPRGSRPERAERSPQNIGPSYRVYVGNLPWDVDDVRLEQVFSEHGKVVSARVVYDRESGRSRGFGFVTMSSESELNDAIENLDGQSLGGRAIRVNVAEEKPRRF